MDPRLPNPCAIAHTIPPPSESALDPGRWSSGPEQELEHRPPDPPAAAPACAWMGRARREARGGAGWAGEGRGWGTPAMWNMRRRASEPEAPGSGSNVDSESRVPPIRQARDRASESPRGLATDVPADASEPSRLAGAASGREVSGISRPVSDDSDMSSPPRFPAVLAGSRGVADPRPAPRDPAQNQRPATRDPERAGPPGPARTFCQIPVPARTFVRIGIFFLIAIYVNTFICEYIHLGYRFKTKVLGKSGEGVQLSPGW